MKFEIERVELVNSVIPPRDENPGLELLLEGVDRIGGEAAPETESN